MVVERETKMEDPVLEYMVSKHTTLTNDYKTPDEQSPEYCVSIAEQIFLLLTAQRKSPYIAKVHNKISDGKNLKNITPKAFNGRVKWGEHHVCCDGKLVYDPMVSAEPVRLEDYLKNAFEEEIKLDTWFMTLGDFF